MSEKFEPIDRQPYRAEITDQGTSETKTGVPIVKIYCRLLGKPGASDPDAVVDPIPVGQRPEVEVVTFLDETHEYYGFRARDLEENLGWDAAAGDASTLDPRTEGYINVVGKRITIAPTVKDDKVYWGFCRGERKLKRFVGDKPVTNLKAKASGMAAAYAAFKAKKSGGVPAGAEAGAAEPIPF